MARGDDFLWLRGRIYTARFYVNGDLQVESTGECDEEAARNWLRKRMKKVHAAEETGEVFESAKMRKYTIDKALDGLENRWKLDGKATKKNFSHLKQTREAFGSYRVTQLDADIVDAFAKERLEDGYARASVNRWS